jgi:hypothetical protein
VGEDRCSGRYAGHGVDGGSRCERMAGHAGPHGPVKTTVADDAWASVVELVERQSNDRQLWFTGRRTPLEVALQEELRRLHDFVERAARTAAETHEDGW